MVKTQAKVQLKSQTKAQTKKVDYTAMAVTGAISIVIISIALLLLVNLLFPFRRHEFLDMPTIFTIGSVLSLLMFVLSVYLIFIYLRDYLELKSNFTFGLLLMMVALMLFSLSSMPLLTTIFGVYGRPGLFSVIPYIFTLISLAILAWLSSK